MKNRQQTIRKAAILVASLDSASADALLGQMSSQQAELVRREVRELGPIDPAEQSDVIDEFFRIGPLVPDKQPPGIELDDRLARRLAMRRTDTLTDCASHGHRHNAPPFRFLHEAQGESLAPFLEREHPQTIAVVLSHLLPDHAATVLAALPAGLQAEVARRLVDLEETDPEILREVERGLESWLSEQVRGDRRRAAGLQALHNILAAADRRTKQDIVANLAQHDRQLAGKLSPAPTPLPPSTFAEWTPPDFAFADLTGLDDASLAAVLRGVDAEVVLLALAGATPELVQRVLQQLPLEGARALRYALDHMGPTRLSDVEEAQQQVVAVVQQLRHRGQLARGPSRGFSLAA